VISQVIYTGSTKPCNYMQ